MRTAIVAILMTVAPAHAGLAPRVAPMTAADDDVCELLKAERGDSCKRLARLGNATVYGTAKGIRRVVLAIADGDDVLVSPPIDVAAGATTTTMRTVQLDGRPGVLVDVTTTRKRDTFETILACRDGRCTSVELGSCRATIDPDGNVATSCGDHATLSLTR